MTLRAQRGLTRQSPQSPRGQIDPSREIHRHTTACPGRRQLCTLVTQEGPSSNRRSPTDWGSPQSYTHQLRPAPPPLDTPHRPMQVTRRQPEKSNHSGEIHRATHTSSAPHGLRPHTESPASKCAAEQQEKSNLPGKSTERPAALLCPGRPPLSTPAPSSATTGEVEPRREVKPVQVRPRGGLQRTHRRTTFEKVHSFTRTVRHKRIFRILNDPMLKTNA